MSVSRQKKPRREVGSEACLGVRASSEVERSAEGFATHADAPASFGSPPERVSCEARATSTGGASPTPDAGPTTTLVWRTEGGAQPLEHTKATCQLQLLDQRLQKEESEYLHDVTAHRRLEEALRDAKRGAEACATSLGASAQRLGDTCTATGQPLSFDDWVAFVCARERSLAAERGALAQAVELLRSTVAAQSRSMDLTSELRRRLERKQQSSVLLFAALREAVERLGQQQSSHAGAEASRKLAEQAVEKLVATLEREKHNAMVNEYAHQIRHAFVLAKAQGATEAEAEASARAVVQKQMSDELLSRVDRLDVANRRAGNHVTDCDSRDATADAPEPRAASQ